MKMTHCLHILGAPNLHNCKNTLTNYSCLPNHILWLYALLPKAFLPYVSKGLGDLPHSDIKYVAAYRAGNSHVSQAFASYNHTGD